MRLTKGLQALRALSNGKLLGIQTALVQTPYSKGFAEVNMQFRCSTAYSLPLW
jgi:hypothetical protein